MKNIWKKVPAWLKAIILNFVLLIPPIVIIQSTAKRNLTILPEWGWSALVGVAVLYLYWRLIKQFTNFTEANDVKLSLSFNLRKPGSWFMILGIICITLGAIQIGASLTGAVIEKQESLIGSFMSHGPLMAIPVLFVLAVTAGVVEEITYRCVMQNTLLRSYNKWVSFGIVAMLFALTHFLPLALLAPYLIVSLSISLVADREKTLGVVVFAHFAVDFLIHMLEYFIPEAPAVASTMNLVWISLFVLGLLMIYINVKSGKQQLQETSIA